MYKYLHTVQSKSWCSVFKKEGRIEMVAIKKCDKGNCSLNVNKEQVNTLSQTHPIAFQEGTSSQSSGYLTLYA